MRSDGATTIPGEAAPAARVLARGRVALLGRWPAKSAGGEAPTAVELDAHGVVGDRAYAVREHGRAGGTRLLTARQEGRLLLWHAAYGAAGPDPAAGPPPATFTAPDGRTFDTRDRAALEAALRRDLGRDVDLLAEPGRHPDLADTVLLTTEASRAAAEGALGRPLDLRRFRTNLHLDLDVPAYAEERWEGARVRVGDEVVLRLLHPCIRCKLPTRDPDTSETWPDLLRWLARERDTRFGINAAVERPGRLRVDDAVVVEAAG